MSDEQTTTDRSDILSLTTQIVTAHLSNNTVSGAEVPALIQTVFDTLAALGNEPASMPTPSPAVPVRRSVAEDYIICLEDGKKLKLLKRHLMTAYGMTPEQYRVKWGLPPDYPMVAPSYSLTRRELAKAFGLGRKPAPVPGPAPKGTSKKRGKAKAA